MKILVADDSGALAPACRLALAGMDHELRLVGDGLEALRCARAWTPDVVLAQVQLKRMDGLALTAALHAVGLLRPTAVMLVGTASDAHAHTRSRELGVAAHLASPLGAAELRRELERLQQPERWGAAGLPVKRRRGVTGARR